MSAQLLIRLTPTLLDRLEAACRARGVDKTETARNALIAEVQRLEEQVLPAERKLLDQLASAGLDLTDVVRTAVDRKLLEDAQLRMPAVELLQPAGGGR